jgi:hypothetical protein
MKKSIILVSSFIAFSALAADDFLVRKGTEQVSAARQELTATLRDIGNGASMQNISRKLVQIQRRLVGAEKNLMDSLTSYPPIDPITPDDPDYPPYPPAPSRVQMSAKCEIDDDADFTPGQMSGGTLKGPSLQAILSDCESVARASGSSQYSYGVSDVRVIQKPGYYVQATCQIDDDADFTFDQIVVGELAGRDFVDIIAQCKMAATAAYKGNGSAGIKNPKIEVNQFPVSADCHLDDDADFTENQFVFGKIGARSVSEAVAQCAALAKHIYAGNGSSGLRNIVQK